MKKLKDPSPPVILIIICLMTLMIAACHKASVDASPSGSYSGAFLRQENGVRDYQGAGSTATIVFTGGSFSSSVYISYPNADGIPTTASGTYQLKNDSVIFMPNLPPTANALLSPFIPAGGFEYHFNGDSLIVTQSYQPNSFNQYRLKKN